MIKISRSPQAPEALLTAGTAARQQLCEDVDGGATRLRFDDKIYGHADVRARLATDQYGKCCYCESPLDRGTIDHFRPKLGVQQDPEETQISRGYYWLAYEWTNLYLACSTCNMSYKRQAFPLANPLERVCHHKGAARLSAERPLLLDPGVDEPDLHLRFERQTPVPVTPRGRRTIEVLRLDRSFLEEERSIALGLVELLLDILDSARWGGHVPADILDQACLQLALCSESKMRYSAAIRGALRRHLGMDVVFPLSSEALRRWARPDSR